MPRSSEDESSDTANGSQPVQCKLRGPQPPPVNPLKFIQVKPPANLYKSSAPVRQQPIEIVEVKKEEPEDWQNDLEGWKSSRRKRQEHLMERVSEIKKIEEGVSNGSRRNKTFSEMLKNRKSSIVVYNEESENDFSEFGLSGSGSFEDNSPEINDNDVTYEKAIQDYVEYASSRTCKNIKEGKNDEIPPPLPERKAPRSQESIIVKEKREEYSEINGDRLMMQEEYNFTESRNHDEMEYYDIRGREDYNTNRVNYDARREPQVNNDSRMEPQSEYNIKQINYDTRSMETQMEYNTKQVNYESRMESKSEYNKKQGNYDTRSMETQMEYNTKQVNYESRMESKSEYNKKQGNYDTRMEPQMEFKKKQVNYDTRMEQQSEYNTKQVNYDTKRSESQVDYDVRRQSHVDSKENEKSPSQRKSFDEHHEEIVTKRLEELEDIRECVNLAAKISLFENAAAIQNSSYAPAPTQLSSSSSKPKISHEIITRDEHRAIQQSPLGGEDSGVHTADSVSQSDDVDDIREDIDKVLEMYQPLVDQELSALLAPPVRLQPPKEKPPPPPQPPQVEFEQNREIDKSQRLSIECESEELGHKLQERLLKLEEEKNIVLNLENHLKAEKEKLQMEKEALKIAKEAFHCKKKKLSVKSLESLNIPPVSPNDDNNQSVPVPVSTALPPPIIQQFNEWNRDDWYEARTKKKAPPPPAKPSRLSQPPLTRNFSADSILDTAAEVTLRNRSLPARQRPASQGINYQHWLLQEAEHRRITEEQQRKAKSKHLPDAVILSLTQRVQQRQSQRISPPKNGFDDKMLSVSGKKKCSHCNLELGRGAAMIIESLRLFYHIDCFKCCVCCIQLGDGLMGTDVRVRNGKLHCHSCYSSDDGVKFSCV